MIYKAKLRKNRDEAIWGLFRMMQTAETVILHIRASFGLDIM